MRATGSKEKAINSSGRPLPTAMLGKSRPKMQGGFLVSDDSETDDSNIPRKRLQQHPPSKPALLPQHELKSALPTHISSVRTATPSGQINRSRLNALRARIKKTTQNVPPNDAFHRSRTPASLASSKHGSPGFMRTSSEISRPPQADVVSTAGICAQPTAKKNEEPLLQVSPINSLELKETLNTKKGVSNCALEFRNADAVNVAKPLNAEMDGNNDIPRTLIQPIIHEAEFKSASTPLPVQKATTGVPDRFQDENPASRPTKACSAQYAERSTSHHQSSLNSDPPLPRAKIYSNVLARKQDRAIRIDNPQNNGQLKISAPHTKSSRADALGQPCAQKRKVNDSESLEEKDTAPSKKIATTSEEVYGTYSHRIDIDQMSRTSSQPKHLNQTTMTACRTDSSSPLTKRTEKGDTINPYASTTRGSKNSEEKQRSPKASLPVPQSDYRVSNKSALEANSGAFPASSLTDMSSTDLQRAESLRPSLSMKTKEEIPKAMTSCKKSVPETHNQMKFSPAPVSRDAEPYFEYSVSEKWWSDEQDEKDAKEVSIILRPFTDINEANSQAETLFQRLREANKWIPRHTLSEWTIKRDESGCIICKASFSPLDNPYKEHFAQIWVRRDYVSRLANQNPQELTPSSFLSSTVFVLRLVKLVAPAESSAPSEGSSSSSTDGKPAAPLRVYQPVVRSEVFTTLQEANRAARDQQLELSHEKEPKDVLTAKWQEADYKRLGEKLRLLNVGNHHGEAACWESVFNGIAIDGGCFELMVEQAGICGPRNL